MSRDQELDRKISANVSTQLASRGLRSPCRVVVNSSGGSVTLTGKVQYEHQRTLAVQVARNVINVRRVVDQLQVLPRVDRWKAERPAPAPTVPGPVELKLFVPPAVTA